MFNNEVEAPLWTRDTVPTVLRSPVGAPGGLACSPCHRTLQILPRKWLGETLLSEQAVAAIGRSATLADLKELFYEVVRFEIELWNAVEARLKSELDLPLTHYEPMSVMDCIEGCRVYDIANELVITTGGASKLVDRIEESGFCCRRPNPDDRRSSLVELTPSGRRMLTRARGVVEDELERRLAGAVSDRALEQFKVSLERLLAAARRTDQDQTA
jgi:MarR family transcriptional regulator, organic hydroperoxide resistance regulator